MSIITPIAAPVAVHISAQPNTPPIRVEAFVDPNSAPPNADPSSVAFGVLCLAVAWNRAVILSLAQRVSLLEVAMAEAAALESPPRGAPAEIKRSTERYQLSLATIKQQAAGIELTPPPSSAAANDEPSAAASALDALDPSTLS